MRLLFCDTIFTIEVSKPNSKRFRFQEKSVRFEQKQNTHNNIRFRRLFFSVNISWLFYTFVLQMSSAPRQNTMHILLFYTHHILFIV